MKILILPNTSGTNNLVEMGAVKNEIPKETHVTIENPTNFFKNDFPVSAIYIKTLYLMHICINYEMKEEKLSLDILRKICPKIIIGLYFTFFYYSIKSLAIIFFIIFI